MFDTGLTNELMALNTGFENSVTQAEQQAADTYWVITSNAKGDQASPFTGDTAQLVQMTEQELQQVYQDSGQIQDQFGSFENYMTYIGESQDWVQSAEWMNATVEYNPGDKEWLYQPGEDAMWKPGEREDVKTKIDSDLIEAKRSAYNSWLNEGAELMDKWGLNRTIYNSDGDQFKWTGSGYQKTIKIDDSFDFGGFVGSIALAALTAGAAGFLAPTLAGALGVSNAVAKGLITAGIDLAQGEGIGLGTALSLVGGDVLPGGTTLGEMADNGDITQDVLDAIVGEITNPDNYKGGGNGGPVVVWGGHGGTDEVGNPIINIPDFTEDPEGGGGGASTSSDSSDAPTDTDGDGIPDSENEPPNDPLNGEDPNQGQYEVVQVLEDGSVVVNDNRDGDVWILPPGGDYQVGDIVPESDMTDARVGDGDLNSDTTDPNAEPEPEPTVVWPDVLGGYVDPTVINPNTGDDAVTTGDGNDGAGESGNNGDGVGNDGTGEGDGGDGNGDGSEAANNQWIDGSGGTSNTQWTRLFEQPQFRSRFKQFQTGMFAPQSKQLPAPAIQDYSAQRMGLLSQAYKDLS